MISTILRLHGCTRSDWHLMTFQIPEAIFQSGGGVLDSHLFSNQAVCFQFELPRDKAGALVARLRDLGVRLYPESEAILLKHTPLAPADFRGTINVSFVHAEADYHQVIPAVPG